MRRELRSLKRQISEMGKSPAEGPQRANPLHKHEFKTPTIPTEGTPQSRAFEIMNQFDLK